MKYSCLVLICFIFSLPSGVGQSNNLSSNHLIPRSAFFKGEQRFNFQADQSGTTLYFQNNKNGNAIFYCSTKTPERLDSIGYDGRVRQFKPSESGLLTIWTDSLFHLRLGEAELSIPEHIQSLKLVSEINAENEIAIEINTTNEEASGIYILNLTTPTFYKKHELQTIQSLFFDEHFNLIAGNSQNDQAGNSIFYFKDTSWVEIKKHPWEVDQLLGGFSKVISVTNNGKHIYFTSNLNTDKSRLYIFDVQNETVSEAVQNDLVDLLPFGASLNTKGEVTSVVGLYAKTVREIVDLSSKADFEFLASAIKGDISFAQALDQDKKWLIREFTGGPAKIYLFDRKTKKLDYLLSDYPELDKEKLATRHPFSITSRDGLNLPVHVYLPPGSDQNGDGIPDQALPTVMYVHGGPWVGVVHWNQYFHWRNFQLLANRGYAVINCEFRGGTGLGKAFVEQSIKTWGTNMTNDKVDIANWAVQKNIALEDKIGLWGWSYGGYATMAGLTFSPDSYACGVSMYGISDLESFGKTPFVDNDFWKNMVGDPYDTTEAKMLQRFSPINYVENIQAPLLLTTGSKDQRVPQSQIDNMAEAMKNHSKKVIYFYYPEEGHDYRDPDSWISFWAVAEHFLQDHLKGNAEPLGNDFDLGNKVVVEGGEYIKRIAQGQVYRNSID